ncbi:MAG: SDR family NAD(P)-dependent oxidoreductase [Pseudomonadales bacterium]|nr:SDR family NAD(P)-dependent oxidoreductase [Pseudomonadales bacterium]
MKQPFGYRTTALEAVEGIDLTGKTAIVTGGYSGIGVETARALATAGASVTIACRDYERAVSTAQELNEATGKDHVRAGELDLSRQASVRAFAEAWLKEHSVLHILVNNAAVMACPYGTTQDGFETQFGTNHLGHFALFKGLLPALQRAGGARVICLSSTGHALSPVVFEDIGFEHRAYDPWLSYGQAKSANALMAVGIQRRYASQGIEAFAVHPGGIMTSLQRHMTDEEIQSRGWVDENGKVNELFKTVEQGASTSVWAATSAYLAGRGGQYLHDCEEAVIHDVVPENRTGVMRWAVDPDNADRLWEVSETMLAQLSEASD